MRERTIGRMLKKLGLRSKIARKYKHTTDSNHRLLTAPNFLDRQFTVTQPNNVWTTDIPISVYPYQARLAVFMCDAFNYGMSRQDYPTGVMVHSLAKQCFSSSQYCSRNFRALLLMNNWIQRMSCRGLV